MKYEGNTYPLIGFGERLKEARKAANYSKKGLAKQAKISTRLISYYENNELRANFTVVAKLAAILNVSLDWLAYGKENDKKNKKEDKEDKKDNK